MTPEPTRPLCLFSGEELGPETKFEHTILQSLGGRIRSRRATTNEFNEKCGERVDPWLTALYRPVFAVLAPALPANVAAGATFHDRHGRRYTLRDGVTEMEGIEVVERKEGRPVAAVATDPDALLRWASKSVGLEPSQIRLEKHKPMSESIVYSQMPVTEPRAELSALKCVLLTFDETLAGQGEHRFTRLPELAALCSDVRRCVAERQEVDLAVLHTHVLGMQLAREPRYGQILSWLPRYGKKDFEHVLIAVGHTPAGTLDVAWSIAGVEWQGFRLCSNWGRFDFTCAVVSQTLRNGRVHGPFWFDHSTPICKPTLLRSAPGPGVSDRDLSDTVELISAVRAEAYKRAVLYVEMQCDEQLRQAFTLECRQGSATDHRLLDGILSHTSRLYPDTTCQRGEFRSEFGRFREKGQVYERIQIVPDAPVPDDVDWERCIADYRSLLQRLVNIFGLPGHRFSVGSETELQTFGNHTAFTDIPQPTWRPADGRRPTESPPSSEGME